MRFSTVTVLPILAAFCLAGCGGGGGNGGGGGGDNGGNGGGVTNKYAGNYAGTYENQLEGFGPFSFTVNSAGTITNGTINIDGTTVTLSGSVTSSGVATLTPGGNNPTSTGTLSAAGGTAITGTLKDTSGDTFWFDALYNPVGPVGASQFSNDYSGSFKNNTKGDTGIDSFYVDGNGNITGAGLIATSNAVEFATLGGSISSSGELSLTFKVNGVTLTTITGHVILANSSLTGSLTNTSGDSLTLDVQVVN